MPTTGAKGSDSAPTFAVFTTITAGSYATVSPEAKFTENVPIDASETAGGVIVANPSIASAPALPLRPGLTNLPLPALVV